MRIRHLDMVPSVHPEAYVAPTAVLSGEVRVGRGSCIMHGAEPARIYAPGDAEAIRAGIAEAGGFLPFVFGIEEAADRREQMQAALQRYTTAIARHHRQDEVIPISEGGE